MSTSPTESHDAEQEHAPRRKVWSVGSLRYSTASLIIVLCWLVGGDFALSLRDRANGPVFQLMLHEYSASDTFTAILMGSVPATLALIFSPIISFKSDRHRGKWGRRIPFLLVAMPISVVSLAGLALSPAMGSLLHRLLATHSPGSASSVLIFMSIFWVLFDFSGILGGAVFGALLNDIVPQHFLGRVMGAFRVVSLGAGIIFYHWIFGNASGHFFAIFMGMALVSGLGTLAVCLKVKEGTYPPPPPVEAAPGISTFFAAAKGYFQECLGHSYYWWYFTFGLITGVMGHPFNTFGVYYALSLNMSKQTYGDCAAITYVISMFLSYPLGALADRFHPLRMGLVAVALYGFLQLLGAIFIQDAHTFGIALVAIGVGGGVFLTSVASLGLRLLPRSNFAQFTSAGGIMGWIVGIGFGPLVGMILDHSHHNYRLTLYMGFFLSMAALLCGLVLYRRFMACGGPENYVAPQSAWNRKPH